MSLLSAVLEFAGDCEGAARHADDSLALDPSDWSPQGWARAAANDDNEDLLIATRESHDFHSTDSSHAWAPQKKTA